MLPLSFSPFFSFFSYTSYANKTRTRTVPIITRMIMDRPTTTVAREPPTIRRREARSKVPSVLWFSRRIGRFVVVGGFRLAPKVANLSIVTWYVFTASNDSFFIIHYSTTVVLLRAVMPCRLYIVYFSTPDYKVEMYGNLGSNIFNYTKEAAITTVSPRIAWLTYWSLENCVLFAWLW